MTALFLALALSGQTDSGETVEDGLHIGLLFHSTASADLGVGLKDLSVDTLTVFPGGYYNGDWVQLSALAALDYSADSTLSALETVSAGAFFRWPGSPWVGTGVSMGVLDPFIAGFDDPVREWQNYDVLDSTVVTVEAGGLLGLQGFWNQFGDSLSWYGVKSPWLGFGTVRWNGIDENGSELETYTGFLDLRRVKPWFLFVGENSQWTYLTEIRGWKPLRNHDISIEIAPRIYFKEDSNTVGLTAYLHGEARTISGFLKAVMDVNNGLEPCLSAGLDVLSEAGIAWSMDADFNNLNNFQGTVSGFYRMSPAGCGGALDIVDDSIRVTATALYSPVPGVSTEVSVMSNLDNDSPKPGCLFRVFGARDDFTGAITVEWGEGSTTLGMEVSAWID